MKNGILILLSILLVIASPSCDNTVIFEKNVTITNGIWIKSDPVEIGFAIQDTLNPVNLIINLRHTTDYEFSNLFLFVDTRYPNGTGVRDTLEIILAGHDGRWFGKGFGKIKEMNIPVRKGLIFPMAGNYALVFEQAMRVNELNGIEDIGITIEKSQNY
jgi:gliding motility-associated lipoprotein GldH